MDDEMNSEGSNSERSSPVRRLGIWVEKIRSRPQGRDSSAAWQARAETAETRDGWEEDEVCPHLSDWDDDDAENGTDFLLALADQVRMYSARINNSAIDLDSRPAEWRSIGLIWRQMRLKSNLKRDEVSQRVGISRHQLTFFENGLIPWEDMSADFIEKLASALGRPELASMHNQIWLTDASKDDLAIHTTLNNRDQLSNPGR